MTATTLTKRASAQLRPEDVCGIPAKIVEGHYRYCNEFLWPVMHEMPEIAVLNDTDRSFYQQMNMSVACNVLHDESSEEKTNNLVNDYQLALTPQILSRSANMSVAVFWHIPWPKKIDSAHTEPLCEIAKGLLGADSVGFHLAQYSTNFLHFVAANFPDCRVDFANKQIIQDYNNKVTQVLALPLGLDTEFWSEKAKVDDSSSLGANLEELVSGPFVLSVDRADYTKGVVQRLDAIEKFFENYPDRVGEVSFLQICQRSRAGLHAFDAYWTKCRERACEINSKFQVDNWSPIIWVDTPLSAGSLAWLYKRAAAMLISPVFDGLNLTAKEFAVCSDTGVLLLSPGAGVWHELGEHAITVIPALADDMSRQIELGLNMSLPERRIRLEAMKVILSANSLEKWWQNFGGQFNKEKKVVQLAVHEHRVGRHRAWQAT